MWVVAPFQQLNFKWIHAYRKHQKSDRMLRLIYACWKNYGLDPFLMGPFWKNLRVHASSLPCLCCTTPPESRGHRSFRDNLFMCGQSEHEIKPAVREPLASLSSGSVQSRWDRRKLTRCYTTFSSRNRTAERPDAKTHKQLVLNLLPF